MGSNLSFVRILDWFTEKGVKFNLSRLYHPTMEECLAICEGAVQISWPTYRSAHDATGQQRSVVRRDPQDAKADFLNKYHEKLIRRRSKVRSTDRPVYMLDLVME